MIEEPKEDVVEVADRTNASDFDAKADEFFNDKDNVTPEDSSTSKDDEEPEVTEESEDDGDDHLKTPEKSEETDDTKGKDPRDLAFRKAWNEAKAKYEPIVKEHENLKGQMEEFKKVTSSPDYIRFSMKAQGYTDEAIDNRLRELGHKVEVKDTNGLDLVLNRLGVDISKLDENGKNYVNTNVSDMVKVADILIQDRLSRLLPGQIQPLQDKLESTIQKESATEILDKISGIVETEGVLDLEKDVAPILDKFMEDNPEATQKEIFEYFKEKNHELAMERMKLGKRKEARDESRKDLRGSREGTRVMPQGLKKTGDFDKDADSLLDALSINN
jgi:hypothetical protein